MKNTHLFFLVIFVLSLTLHLLIALSLYYPDNSISFGLSAGMFPAWLFVSKSLRELSAQNPDFNPLHFFRTFPPFLKYSLMFFAFYALINFALIFSVDTGNGWLQLNPGHERLRGISGFWPLFYVLAYAVLKQKNNFSG